ncbi:hypothetical protein ACN9ML_11875 [Dyadobacter endophyticus]|uniref:hypothetical protein n=1 Tax=Dyadobacter endophyticus TaxID=1749036 RepID=UPI003CE7E894
MKFKLVILVALISSSISSKGQVIPWARTPIDTSYYKLAMENIELRNDLAKYKEDFDRQLDGIDRSISTASALFGAMSVVGIALGVYISRQYDKIQKAEIAAREAADEAKRWKSWIEKEPTRIYKLIKREETLHILQKLTLVPENIKNVQNHLLTSDLEYTDFDFLKRGYLSIRLNSQSPHHSEYYQNYLHVLFHHFAFESAMDRQIRDDFFTHIHQSIRISFASDLERVIPELIRAFTLTDVKLWEKEINMFIDAISDSYYSSFPRWPSFIIERFNSASSLVEFCQILDSEKLNMFSLLFKKALIDSAAASNLIHDLVDKHAFDRLTAKFRAKIDEHDRMNSNDI